MMNKSYILLISTTMLLQNAVSQDLIISQVSNHNQNHFGWSISGDNDYIAVSDPRDSIYFYGNGCVNIYKKNNTTWDYIQKLQNNNVKPYDYFGHRIFMNEGNLAVSAIGDGTMGFMSGAVHIFQLDNGSWKYTQTLHQDSVGEKTQFGESLFISGQYLFVGAPGLGMFGAVFVYVLSGGTYTFLQKISNPIPLKMQFGKSISLSGDYLFVGAPSTNMAMYKGTVFIFKRSSSLWELYNKQNFLEPDNNDYGALFGFSVSAEQDGLLVGAPHANVSDGSSEEYYFAGKAYYYKNISGTFTKQKEFYNPELASHDLYGSDVMISDSILYISSPKDDVDSTDAGTIFIYMYDKNLWVEKSLSSPDKVKNQYFSNSFFVFDRQLFIGSAGVKKEKNKGRILAFDINKLMNITGTKQIGEYELISIFPNPADKVLKIQIANDNHYSIKICSADGKIFNNQSLKGNQVIDISNLSNGYYVISVNMRNQTYTEELVVLHK